MTKWQMKRGARGLKWCKAAWSRKRYIGEFVQKKQEINYKLEKMCRIALLIGQTSDENRWQDQLFFLARLHNEWWNLTFRPPHKQTYTRHRAFYSADMQLFQHLRVSPDCYYFPYKSEVPSDLPDNKKIIAQLHHVNRRSIYSACMHWHEIGSVELRSWSNYIHHVTYARCLVNFRKEPAVIRSRSGLNYCEWRYICHMKRYLS